MNKCELCSRLARMYCESDRASLCYDCDEKVHSANFLVAKHSRTLLCQKCQTPTPWLASGVKLGRAVSVCVSCADNSSHAKPHSTAVIQRQEEIHRRGNDDVLDNDDREYDQDEDCDTDDDDGEYSYSERGDEEEDGENQVVPWSSPPPSASSSSSEEFSSSGDAILDSEDDAGCSSERVHGNAGETMSCGSSENNEGTSFRPLKVIRSNKRDREAESKSTEEIVHSLKRIRQGMITDDDDSSTTVLNFASSNRF